MAICCMNSDLSQNFRFDEAAISQEIEGSNGKAPGEDLSEGKRNALILLAFQGQLDARFGTPFLWLLPS